jgi:hypothetical protein
MSEYDIVIKFVLKAAGNAVLFFISIGLIVGIFTLTLKLLDIFPILAIILLSIYGIIFFAFMSFLFYRTK